METKLLEAHTPDSCWNRAKLDEPVFVLLGRDQCAPAAIVCWIVERIASGKNKAADAQIREAIQSAADMAAYRKSLK